MQRDVRFVSVEICETEKWNKQPWITSQLGAGRGQFKSDVR